MNNSTPLLIGLCSGILAAVIVLVIRKLILKGKGTEYDERQQVIRGKSYTIAFYTTIILETIYLFISEFNIKLPAENNLIQFVILMTGLIVAVYIQVWNDAYFSLKENPRRWFGVMLAATILNIISFIRLSHDEGIFHDGHLDFSCITIILAIYIIILMILLWIKSVKNKKNELQDAEK